MRSGGPGVFPGKRQRTWRAGEIGDLSVVTFSHAIQHVYVTALAVAYPLVVADFGISYGTLGVLLGVAGLVGGLLQAAAGMVRRVSARLLLVAQNCGLAAAAVLAALAPSFAMFSAARMVGAFTSWPQHPVGSAYLTKRFPTRSGFALSWHTTGGTIGTLTVPLVAAALFDAFGWRWALVGFAAMMAGGGALVLIGLRDRRVHHTEAPDEGGEEIAAGGANPPVGSQLAAGGEDMPGVSVRAALRRRRVLAVLVASTIAAAGRGLGAITTYVPAYLESELGLAHLQSGAILTVILVAGVIGPLAAGRLSDRLGRGGVLITVYFVGAAALAAFVLVGASVVALAGIGVLVGAFAYAESPLLQSLFADGVEGADTRSAFGMYFAIAYGVGSLWLTALGQIIEHAGFQAAFFAMAGSFLLAGTIVTLGRPRARQ